MLKRLKATLADFFQQADLVLLALCCASTIYGIILIFSATRYMSSNKFVVVQTVAMLLGICAYIACSMLDLEGLLKHWKWILAFNIGFILLLLTPFGASEGGNRAWLRFPFLPVSIGPAEVVKISFVLLLAFQLEWLREEKRDLRSFPSAMMVAVMRWACAVCILWCPATWATAWCSCSSSCAWPLWPVLRCGGLRCCSQAAALLWRRHGS